MIATLICVWVSAPAFAQPQPQGGRESWIELVVHAQGAGTSAVDMDASRPTGVANADYYNFFYATGSGQRQFGTNQDVREEDISAPLGLDGPLAVSSEAAAGRARARSQVSAVIRKTDRSLNVVGTAVAESEGLGAGAFASFMLGVAVKGRSTVRVENCDLFEQGVLSSQAGFSRQDGSCTFQVSGDPARSVDPQGIPIPANARDGQFIMFDIDIELGALSGSAGSVNGSFAIEVLPGAGECVLVIEGPGTSLLEDMAVVDILDTIPDIIMYARTDRDLEAIQGEIDFGLSPHADEEARATAEAAAANLARPVDADLRLQFSGPATTDGIHTLSLTPRNGDARTLEFDFDEARRFEDLEAFIREVVEAVRSFVEQC